MIIEYREREKVTKETENRQKGLFEEFEEKERKKMHQDRF